jgi:nicotinamide mononucleotide transporter
MQAIPERAFFRGLEVMAVVFNLLYTYLYIQNNSWCFVFGIAGPALLFIVCKNKKIYADAGLQVLYVLLAIYGWWNSTVNWETQHFSGAVHFIVIALTGLAAAALGKWLKNKTDAQLPYLDSAIALYSVSATVLMMMFVPENWLYFMVINALSIVLYWRRRLYWGSFMFVVYLVLAIEGYFDIGLL